MVSIIELISASSQIIQGADHQSSITHPIPFSVAIFASHFPTPVLPVKVIKSISLVASRFPSSPLQ
jgi:hypothetical protein